MSDEASAFKQAASKALRKWLKQNLVKLHIKNHQDFCNILGIPLSRLENITQARSIVDAPEIYAKLYVVTGLAELDPRKVPSLKIKLPKGGETVERSMGFTEEEFARWKARYNSPLNAIEVKQQAKEVTSVDWLDLFAKQLAPYMERYLHSAKSTDYESVEGDVRKLISELRRIQSFPYSKRLRFAAENAELFMQLAGLASYFSAPSNMREIDQLEGRTQ